MKTTLTATLTAILMLTASACTERDGPAERLGESLDNTAEKISDNVDDIGNDVEDACEELKKSAGAKDTDC